MKPCRYPGKNIPRTGVTTQCRLTELKVNARKEIIKIRALINEKENKKTIENINKIKIYFLEKINRSDKYLARLTKKKKKKKSGPKSTKSFFF